MIKITVTDDHRPFTPTQEKRARKMIYDMLEKGHGGGRSASGKTLSFAVEWCEQNQRRYVIDAWPGIGYALDLVPDTIPERSMSELGLNTGLVDMHDKPIHLGDTILFDRREWGDDNNTFVIGFSDGELDIKGTIDDARSWWTVIKKWNDK